MALGMMPQAGYSHRSAGGAVTAPWSLSTASSSSCSLSAPATDPPPVAATTRARASARTSSA
eukprot:scaffold20616_cov63-Phaeocystis_antarctica.AAC.11